MHPKVGLVLRCFCGAVLAQVLILYTATEENSSEGWIIFPLPCSDADAVRHHSLTLKHYFNLPYIREEMLFNFKML